MECVDCNCAAVEQNERPPAPMHLSVDIHGVSAQQQLVEILSGIENMCGIAKGILRTGEALVPPAP